VDMHNQPLPLVNSSVLTMGPVRLTPRLAPKSHSVALRQPGPNRLLNLDYRLKGQEGYWPGSLVAARGDDLPASRPRPCGGVGRGYDVLSWLASGKSRDEILADFPYPTKKDRPRSRVRGVRFQFQPAT
jgi:hypothetical protein